MDPSGVLTALRHFPFAKGGGPPVVDICIEEMDWAIDMIPPKNLFFLGGVYAVSFSEDHRAMMRLGLVSKPVSEWERVGAGPVG